MSVAEVILTLALFVLTSFGGVAFYAYKRDLLALAKSIDETMRVAGDNRDKLQALEVKMATSEERHDGHDQHLDSHEENDDKAFDRVDRKLDELSRDVKELVRYVRSSTPPRGFPRVGG